MDTAAKRHSALSWGQPWRTPPRPSGTIDQGVRQAAALNYSGILVGAPVVPPVELLPTAGVFPAGGMGSSSGSRRFTTPYDYYLAVKKGIMKPLRNTDAYERDYVSALAFLLLDD